MNKQKGMLIVFPSSRTKNLIKECYEKGIKPIVIHPNFNGKNNKNKEYEALVPMVALKQAMVSIKNNYSKYNYIEYTEQDDCRLIVDDVKKNYDILGVICCSDMAPKYTYELRDLLGMSNNPLELVNNGDNKY
ncbi:hypothetical protein FACS189459_3980 [Bacilli bacterium]|nr:hypothetical protein FACS189459_3980 [Bacilli bacterium]